MKTKTFFVLAAAVLAVGLSAADFTLVRGNRAQSAIVLPADAPKAVGTAVEHFNQTLKTITGTALPVVKSAASGNRIVFKLRKTDSLMTADHYAITFPDSRTMKIEGTEYSVQWAFNHIIREFAKAEWVLPESCGLSYTPMKDLTVPAKKIEVRNVTWSVGRLHSNRNIFWNQNMREGIRSGHYLTLYAFPVSKYGKDNSWPEAMMPVLNGKKITVLPNPRSPRNYWQPCYSNPETAKIAVSNILEYLEKHPGTLSICLSTNDNSGFCECKECRKMNYRNRAFRPSESYFTFINRVAAEVCKKHPKLLILADAYAKTYLPPSFKLHPNVLVELSIDFNSCVSTKLMERHKKIIGQWSEKASLLGLWDYSWGYPYPMPRLHLPVHLDMLKYMAAHKTKFYYGQSWTVDAHEGPKHYLIAKLLWDGSLDMKKLEDEWYVRCVGRKAAPHLKAYYKVWNDYFNGPAMTTPWFRSAPSVYMTYSDISCVYALRESDIRTADKAMKQVVALAETKQEKQRADLMMLHWKYTLLRLRMLGAGIYDAKGFIQTKEQALRLLETVRNFPEYQKQYQRISDTVVRERSLKDHYTSKAFIKEGASPLGFKASPVGHLLAASAFASDPEVSSKMKNIADDPAFPVLTREFCRTLRDLNSRPNLLPEGNAENGIPKNIEIDPEMSCYGTLSISQDHKAEGKHSFLVTIKGHDTLFWILGKAKPSTYYLATFKAFIANPSAEGYLEPYLYAERSGRNQQWRYTSPRKLSGGIWQTFSVLTATTPSSDSVRLRIHLRKFDKGDKIYFDDIRLIEVGPAAAESKPAAKAKPATNSSAPGPVFRLEKPADLNNAKALSLNNGVLKASGRGKFMSVKDFVLDPAKKYRLSGEFRQASGSPVRVYFGYAPLNEKGRIIYPIYVKNIPGTETELAADAKRGDKAVKVRNAAKWNGKIGYGYIAFNVKDDFSDLPNGSVIPIVKDGIKAEGEVWEIQLKEPIRQKIPAGTKVRQHSSGGTHIWNGGAANLKDQWTALRSSHLLNGKVKSGAPVDKLWPGTKSVKLVIELDGKADSVTEIRNVKVEEVK